MDPITIAAILGGVSTGLGLWESHNARKDAKKAQKEQEKREAFNNLIRIVGGGMPGATSAVEPLPQLPVAQTVGSLANLADRYGQVQGQNKQDAYMSSLRDKQLAIEQQRADTDKAYKESMMGGAGSNKMSINEAKTALEMAGQVSGGSMSPLAEMEWMKSNPGKPLPGKQYGPEAIRFARDYLAQHGINLGEAPGAELPGSLGGASVMWSK